MDQRGWQIVFAALIGAPGKAGTGGGGGPFETAGVSIPSLSDLCRFVPGHCHGNPAKQKKNAITATYVQGQIFAAILAHQSGRVTGTPASAPKPRLFPRQSSSASTSSGGTTTPAWTSWAFTASAMDKSQSILGSCAGARLLKTGHQTHFGEVPAHSEHLQRGELGIKGVRQATSLVNGHFKSQKKKKCQWVPEIRKSRIEKK